jgi:hypothetical protein
MVKVVTEIYADAAKRRETGKKARKKVMDRPEIGPLYFL